MLRGKERCFGNKGKGCSRGHLEPLFPFSSSIKHPASRTTPKMVLSPILQNYLSAQQRVVPEWPWAVNALALWAVGRGPWGLIGGRYFPVTCPCKSLNLTSTSTAPPHTFGSSSQSHHHNGQHPLCPFHAATKRLQGEATVVQFIRIPVWSCQRQSQARPVLHRQIQPAFTTCPASDSQSSPEHFQSCRHHTTCFPCLPYPPPSYCPPPFPRFPNPASAGCWTRDRGSSLLCLAAFRSVLHSGGAYTAEAVSNSHPGTTCLSWAASLSQERNIGDIPLSWDSRV